MEFYETIKAQGRATPLDTKPDHPIDFDWYLTTYHKLGTSRNVIQGYIGYIPFTEYKAYFEIFNPLDDINETMDILMEMDHMFVLARNKD